MFGSGAGLTLLINTPYNKKHNFSKRAGKILVSESENLHGKSISEDIAIKSMSIGGFDLGEMVVGIANDESGVSSYDGYLGLLGAEVISRFNIILGYSSSVLYLKPNKSFAKFFEFPLSGIKLRKTDGNIIIRAIEKTSSAYKKGIRKGDKLISVNKNSSGDLDLYRELLKKEGEKVHLVTLAAQFSISLCLYRTKVPIPGGAKLHCRNRCFSCVI